MPTPFWKSRETLDRLNRLDRPGFAAEFLRRNPAYQNDYRQTQHQLAQGSLDPQAASTKLARRWGLRFCL